jgi:usherin
MFISPFDSLKMQVKTATSNQTTVGSLEPQSIYRIYLEACTIAGCSSSSSISVITASELPEGLGTLNVTNVTSTSIDVMWANPAVTNGQVVR